MVEDHSWLTITIDTSDVSEEQAIKYIKDFYKEKRAEREMSIKLINLILEESKNKIKKISDADGTTEYVSFYDLIKIIKDISEKLGINEN